MPRELPEGCVFERCVFVIDVSESMRTPMSGHTFSGTQLEVAGEAVCRFVQRKLKTAAEDPALTGAVALVSFNGSAETVLDWTLIGEAEERVRCAVEAIRPDENTDFCAGLSLARDLLQRDHPSSDYPRVGFVDRLVLLTDGDHNAGGDPAGLAEEIKKAGILIFAIAVGNAISEDGKTLLDEMKSVVDGVPWYRHVNDCDELIDCLTGLAGHITR